MKRSEVNFNVQNYTLEALQKLNHQIVEQIKLLRTLDSLKKATNFKINDFVIYNGRGKDNGKVFKITKIKKTNCSMQDPNNPIITYGCPLNLLTLKS